MLLTVLVTTAASCYWKAENERVCTNCYNLISMRRLNSTTSFEFANCSILTYGLYSLYSLKDYTGKYLILRNIGINVLEQDILKEVYFKEIYLDSNNLLSLPSSLCPETCTFDTIDFSRNRIIILKPKQFNRMIVKMLNLSHNQIWKLKNGELDGLDVLTLNLSYNIFNEIEENALANLSTLVSLDLSNGKLNNLPKNIFKNTSKLEVLNISYNELAKLRMGIFDSLTALNVLDLSNNLFASLPNGLLKMNGNLKQLMLRHNKLVTFEFLPTFGSLDWDLMVWTGHNISQIQPY